MRRKENDIKTTKSQARKKLKSRWRCDHCQKFINEAHFPGTLEGIVSEGVEISFGICSKCFKLKGFESKYWDEWAAKQQLRLLTSELSNSNSE